MVIVMMLFLAGVLYDIAAAAFAVSLRQARWIGRGAARAFMIISLVALLLLVIRGLHFPDPHALSTPWYTNPGFIVGIPAVPSLLLSFSASFCFAGAANLMSLQFHRP